MYLKIRDTLNATWMYIEGFVRLEALDPRTQSFIRSVDEEKHSKIPFSSKLLREHLFAHDEYLREASVIVFDDEFLMQDANEHNVLHYRVVRCVERKEDKETFYYVAFNTEGYLCSDHGHTMDRFVVHRLR